MGRNYTPAQQEEIQNRITELVRKHGRMTLNQLQQMTRTSSGTVRRYVDRAAACGDLYRAGKHGIFPSQQAFRDWRENLADESLKAQERGARSDARSDNAIFEECRNSEAMQRVLSFYRGISETMLA
ncbi:DUF977 family protein [Salmonella enterica]|nr:DUF977 family protein [Salmonella enterica]EIM6319449.1 DUF977 family protein [Salmonella enterica]